MRSFDLPDRVGDWQPKLQHWAGLIASGGADEFKETALLPDFLTDTFCGLLGYTGAIGPADTHNFHNSHLSGTGAAASANTFTLSRERHVEVDGKVADAVMGRFQKGNEQFVAVPEGKSTRDPLDRPFAGRRMTGPQQGSPTNGSLQCGREARRSQITRDGPTPVHSPGNQTA